MDRRHNKPGGEDTRWRMGAGIQLLDHWSPLQRPRDRSRDRRNVVGAFARTRDDLAQPARPDRETVTGAMIDDNKQ